MNRSIGAVLTVAVLLGGFSSSIAQTTRTKNGKSARTEQAVPASQQSQKSAEKTERDAPPRKRPSGKVATSWKDIAIPPLPPFKQRQPVRIELKNGMVVFLQENHELPLISGYARIRGGSLSEPQAKVGLVDVYSDVWRTGGTVNLTGDQMDDFLEARAAKVETSGSADSTTIGFDCLKGDFNDVFKLWVELLRQPAFREDKLGLAKDQLNTSIARRNDNSGTIAAIHSGYLAYGKNNPYVRQPEYYTVEAIGRDDLVNWHKQFVYPNNILLGIEGDFDPKQMEATLRQAFEGWEPGPEARKPEVQFTPAKPGIYVAEKDDVNQSEIRMVQLGIDRRNPDYFAVSVFNELFGGGFASRLFSNLRTKRGLAYSVGGGIGSAFDHPGVTRLSIGTKTETTKEAIQGLWQEVDEIKKDNLPTEAELKRAKDSVLNSFIFNFDSPGKVLRERMTYEFYGYPADFLERYRAGVEKVTLADVNRVSQKYLHRE
ncbi:MAG TPA: pitrilysin family protein, partial [Clostridia bacterium]|nr:pitrilysin family protein [Clostridia bacterium]